MSRHVLSVRNLSVTTTRGAGQTAAIVEGASFDLARGEVLALVGESGCGKTKMAQAIMGLLPHDHWNITADALALNGLDLVSINARQMRKIRGREISMIFQEPLTALDPVFSIGNQMAAVYRRHCGSTRRQAMVSAASMLERVGFAESGHMLQRYPHQLSGGMRQRVMIAMAMASKPRVLVADEPTTALDVTTQAQVLDQLTRLGQESGTSILLITHDLGVVAQYCDRAMVMLDGKLVETSSVADLFSRPKHPYTRYLLASSATEVQS